MSRYRILAPWSDDHTVGEFVVQCADLVDERGTVFREGAWRVLDFDRHPVKGKGGTHPFKGETAWSDAERKASDLHFEQLYHR